MDRLGGRFLFGVCVALAVGITANAFISWSTLGSLNHVAGCWTAMALDAVDGVFYRPLYGDLGYGGTRYFPLAVAIQAGLIKLDFAPIPAGLIMSAGASSLVVVGFFLLLKRLGATAGLAVAATIVFMGTACFRWGLTTIRGDMLPTALTIFGVWVCLKESVSRLRLVAAASLFSLAFAAKVTTVFGPIGLALYWFLSYQRRLAIKLLIITTLLSALAIATTQWASDGRFVNILIACASGGTSWSDFASAPLSFMKVMKGEDLGSFVIFLLGLIVWAFSFKFKQPEPIRMWFFATLVVTIIIFGSPGTDFNHLIDIVAVAMAIFVTWMVKGGPEIDRGGRIVLALCGMICLGSMIGDLMPGEKGGLTTRPYLSRYREVISFASTHPGPMLSENSMIPVAMGQNPWLLDAFMYNHISKKRSEFREPLRERIRNKKFATLIVSRPGPNDETGRLRLDERQFSPGFSDLVLGNYTLGYKNAMFEVYVPRADSGISQ